MSLFIFGLRLVVACEQQRSLEQSCDMVWRAKSLKDSTISHTPIIKILLVSTRMPYSQYTTQGTGHGRVPLHPER